MGNRVNVSVTFRLKAVFTLTDSYGETETFTIYSAKKQWDNLSLGLLRRAFI